MSPVARYIVELCIAVYMVAYLLPPAIAALSNATKWAGAPTAVVTIGTTVLAILIIMGIAMALMPKELKTYVGI